MNINICVDDVLVTVAACCLFSFVNYFKFADIHKKCMSAATLFSNLTFMEVKLSAFKFTPPGCLSHHAIKAIKRPKMSTFDKFLILCFYNSLVTFAVTVKCK